MSARKVKCPYCGRELRDDGHARYARHSVTPKSGDTCPLSEMPIVVTGHDDVAYEKRAEVIAELAWFVQDADPWIAQQYLTCLPAAEVQRLLVFALAALQLDQTVDEMWSWIYELPAAKAVAA